MSLVFSVNIYLDELELKDIGMIQPSIRVSIANKGVNYLWKGKEKQRDGDIIAIDRAYQIMLTTNIFDAINEWKFQLQLTMAQDQVPLGTSTFDFKPLIASALQRYGESQCIPLKANFHEPKSNMIIATLKIKVKIIYHPGTEHEKPIEIFMIQEFRDNNISHENQVSPRIEVNDSRSTSHISDEYTLDDDHIEQSISADSHEDIKKQKENAKEILKTQLQMQKKKSFDISRAESKEETRTETRTETKIETTTTKISSGTNTQNMIEEDDFVTSATNNE